MFWYYNKINEEKLIFTSVMAIHRYTGINYDTLNYQFGRKKRKEYVKDNIEIIRTKPITSTYT